jgi:hypothetical protein
MTEDKSTMWEGKKNSTISVSGVQHDHMVSEFQRTCEQFVSIVLLFPLIATATTPTTHITNTKTTTTNTVTRSTVMTAPMINRAGTANNNGLKMLGSQTTNMGLYAVERHSAGPETT